MTKNAGWVLSPAVKKLVRAGVPEPVAQAARYAALAEGVPLARLIAVAEAESGFRNVWGHDQGKWREAAPLSAAGVRRYWARPSVERPNGAGVWQLTFEPYQRAAEALGGLHLLEPQARQAARVIKGLPGHGAAASGMARYNGSGPAAEAYGRRVHAREAAWQRVIGAGS